ASAAPPGDPSGNRADRNRPRRAAAPGGPGAPASLGGMTAERPRVILSCAVSLDGRIDDASPERLRLSSEADFDEVDELRASCDAILVGAGTVRADNPRLLVRSPERQRRRLAEGRTAHLRKVVLSSSGDLDPAARIFTTGDAGCLVYVADDALPAARRRLAGLDGVEAVAAGQPVRLAG